MPTVNAPDSRSRSGAESAAHLPGLAGAIQDGKLWEIPVTAVPHPDDLSRFLGRAEARHAAQLERTFVTIDVASGAIVGSTRFMNINREHRRVEIGFTFIARSWQRTYVDLLPWLGTS